MTATIDDLDRIVVARTAQGEFAGVGRMIAHAGEPTITFVNPDGSRTHWMASLCDPVDLPPEAIEALVPRAADDGPRGRPAGRPRETERDALLLCMLEMPGANYQSVADSYNRHFPQPGEKALSKEAVRKVAKPSPSREKAKSDV